MASHARTYLCAVGLAAVCLGVASVAYVARAGRDSTDAKSSEVPGAERHRSGDRRGLDFGEDELGDVVDAIQLYTMARELDLGEEQRVRFLLKWRKLVDMRRAFWEQRKKRLDGLALVSEGHDAAPGDEDGSTLREILAAFRGQDDAFWSEHRATEDALLGVLTPRQQMRYVVLSSRHRAQTRRLWRLLNRMIAPDESVSPSGD